MPQENAHATLSNVDDSAEPDVSKWYRNLPSKRIGLFDDFAGNEKFLIVFDSLLLWCFSSPVINFGKTVEHDQ